MKTKTLIQLLEKMENDYPGRDVRIGFADGILLDCPVLNTTIAYTVKLGEYITINGSRE